MPSLKYHLHIGERSIGPLRMEQIHKMLEAGSVTPETPIVGVGENEWVPLTLHPDFRSSTAEAALETTELEAPEDDEPMVSLELAAAEDNELSAPVLGMEYDEENALDSLELQAVEPAAPPVVGFEDDDDDVDEDLLPSLEMEELGGGPVAPFESALEDGEEPTSDVLLNCPSCGTVVRFCPYCGKPLDGQDHSDS